MSSIANISHRADAYMKYLGEISQDHTFLPEPADLEHLCFGQLVIAVLLPACSFGMQMYPMSLTSNHGFGMGMRTVFLTTRDEFRICACPMSIAPRSRFWMLP